MEEKKLDLNSIIGFGVIAGILIPDYLSNQPDEKQIAAEAKKNLVQKEQYKPKTQKVNTAIAVVTKDTTATDLERNCQLCKATLGNLLAYSATLPSAKEVFTTIAGMNRRKLPSPGRCNIYR